EHEFQTLQEVARRFRWSCKTLKRTLERHGIPTIGRGRKARLTKEDVEELIRRERELCRSKSPVNVERSTNLESAKETNIFSGAAAMILAPRSRSLRTRDIQKALRRTSRRISPSERVVALPEPAPRACPLPPPICTTAPSAVSTRTMIIQTSAA